MGDCFGATIETRESPLKFVEHVADELVYVAIRTRPRPTSL